MSQYKELLRRSPGFTLGAALEFAQADFQEAFLDVWGLEASSAPQDMGTDDWLEARRVYGMAQQIASIATLLLKRRGVGPQRLQLGSELAEQARAYERRVGEILKVMEDKIPADDFAKLRRAFDSLDGADPRTRRIIFENTLQIQAIKLLPRTLDEVASRLEALAAHVVSARSERTNAYLARVATCYCLDLRTELAVMARAVLDAALQEFLPDDVIKKALRLREKDRVGLGHRLAYIESLALVQAAELRAMHSLKQGGDDAIHVLPGMEPKPDSIMSDLVASLNSVDRFPTASSVPPATDRP